MESGLIVGCQTNKIKKHDLAYIIAVFSKFFYISVPDAFQMTWTGLVLSDDCPLPHVAKYRYDR